MGMIQVEGAEEATETLDAEQARELHKHLDPKQKLSAY